MTAHGFVMRHVLHGAFGGQVVQRDQVSFMSIDSLAALNRWRGCKVPPDTFERSELFWNWSGCTFFVIGRCRLSDQARFDFRRSFKDLEPADALKAANARYPSRGRHAAD